jgi:hypothetical protein
MPYFKFVVMMVMILESPIQNFWFIYWKYRNVIGAINSISWGQPNEPQVCVLISTLLMCLCTSVKISTPFFFFGLFSDTKWVISFLKKKNRISTLIFVWACLTGPILLFMLLFCLKISSAFLVTSPNFTHQSC